VSRTLRLLRAPVTSGLTYRRFVHLLLGAVLLPYLGLVALFVAAVNAGDLRPLDLLLLLVPATAMAVGVAGVPGVRALEVTAARALLGAVVPDPDPGTLDLRGDLAAGAGEREWRVAARLPLRGSEMMSQ
jgi:hypothetical protein